MMSRKDFETIINDTERFQRLNATMKEISEDTKELTKDEFMEFLDLVTKEEAIRTIAKMIIVAIIAMATTKWVFLACIYILIKAFLYDFGIDFLRYCAEDDLYEFRSDEDNGAKTETDNRS